MVTMRDLFPDGRDVSKDGLRRHLPGPVVNVQGFGARGDDSADDTPAIQKAIDAAAAQGGGVVYLPAGIYRVMPPASVTGEDRNGGDALVIDGDNISLVGDGPAHTRLRFRTLNDNDPTETFERVDWRRGFASGTVWRGTAISVRGGRDAGEARRNIVIADLEIDGGAYPGNTRRPGEEIPSGAERGWDISHKGIALQADHHLRGVVLRNLDMHNFRGEIVYGGGDHIDDVTIENCHLHAGAADGISISAGQEIRDNRIHDIGHACVESFHLSKEAWYAGNSFSDAKIGINLQTGVDAPNPAFVSGNIFHGCERNGILFNVENGPAFVTGNHFIDCGYAAPTGATICITSGHAPAVPVIAGVVVTNNVLLRKSRDGGMGILLGCSAGCVLRSIHVSGNVIGSDDPSPDAPNRFLAPVAYGFDAGAEISDVVVRGNRYLNTRRHAENLLAHDPAAGRPMPLMRDNEILGAEDGGNSTVVTDGRTLSRMENEGPVLIYARDPGSDPTPVFAPEDYAEGQAFLLVGGDARRRVYFPQESALYRCREGRYLVPGIELRLRRDGAHFVEVGFVDGRPTRYAEVTRGDVIDWSAHEVCYLAPSEPTVFGRFAGVGHGARVRLVAANGHAALRHGGDISLRGGGDLVLADGMIVEFMRTRDGILRQV